MEKSRDDILVEYFDFYMYYTFTDPEAVKERVFPLPCPTTEMCSRGCWSLFPRLYPEYGLGRTVPYNSNCPCFKLGVRLAMKHLENMLRREGFIDAE